MTPRRKTAYFNRPSDVPGPLSATVTHRVQFGEVDLMGILWHGRYVSLFEEASTELRRRFGMGYLELREAELHAPIVQAHVDYHRPLRLDEVARVTAHLLWNDAARLDVEYEVFGEKGALAATGYTVQMFVNARTGEPHMGSPELLCRCRERWLADSKGTER